MHTWEVLLRQSTIDDSQQPFNTARHNGVRMCVCIWCTVCNGDSACPSLWSCIFGILQDETQEAFTTYCTSWLATLSSNTQHSCTNILLQKVVTAIGFTPITNISWLLWCWYWFLCRERTAAKNIGMCFCSANFEQACLALWNHRHLNMLSEVKLQLKISIKLPLSGFQTHTRFIRQDKWTDENYRRVSLLSCSLQSWICTSPPST